MAARLVQARLAGLVRGCRRFSVSSALNDRYFTKKHEYIEVSGRVGTVGISDHAQHQLGDVVYVELPEAGATLSAGDTAGAIESVKSASDVYTPVSGTVTAVNSVLEDKPQLINKSPYGDGWLFKIELKSPAELQSLMDAAAYDKFCQAEETDG